MKTVCGKLDGSIIACPVADSFSWRGIGVDKGAAAHMPASWECSDSTWWKT
ncbi:MAG: hypothetical protein RI573_11565 [Balneolaceae bacterium]|nr:hypothetical protein [Balneolaceae bacterium]